VVSWTSPAPNSSFVSQSLTSARLELGAYRVPTVWWDWPDETTFGMPKRKPTVSTVNGGVIGLTHTLIVELAPVRVNMIHPGIVGDGPYWRPRPEPRGRADPVRRLARMADIVDAVAFLLRNPAVNDVNLNVDGGTLLG
jgi:NAD(P)-dependent dehydrogenase (short-subunit alcohol dehydrogenase family)